VDAVRTRTRRSFSVTGGPLCVPLKKGEITKQLKISSDLSLPLETVTQAINFAIAEKVMGWKRGTRYGNGNGEWVIPNWKEVLPLTWSRTPQFCESIEAAMQVVEKMRRDHFRFACNDRCDPESGEWWAEFATLEYERGGQASAGTLPEAVCRAALAATENTE
jgi:hypothetical protein